MFPEMDIHGSMVMLCHPLKQVSLAAPLAVHCSKKNMEDVCLVQAKTKQEYTSMLITDSVAMP